MLRVVIIIILGITLVGGGRAQAQDVQFSQFYAAPLYLNPAFTGSTQQARAGINYRNQWPSIEANFVTKSVYFDYFFVDQNSGLGMIATRDVVRVGLASTILGLQYAYQLPLTGKYTVRVGSQIGYTIQSPDLGNLIFSDEIDPVTGAVSPGSSGEVFDSGLRSSFIDVGFGALLYSGNTWFGISAFHLNRPNQSITGEDAPLPIKYSFHAGHKYVLEKTQTKETSFTPVIQYKQQGASQQLDVGTYFHYSPMIFGLWYRGLPLNFNGTSNFISSESLIFVLGYSIHGFNVGYSYDVVVSKLGLASGGAHELSMSITFPLRDPRIPSKHAQHLPCPQF